MSQRPFLLHQLLEHSASCAPASIALVEPGGVTSYGELDRGANRVARALLDLGVRRGDRVAILAPSSRFFIECYYGAMKAGACAVPLNTSLRSAALGEATRHAGARVLCVGKACARSFRAALGDFAQVERVFTETPLALDDAPMTLSTLPMTGDDAPLSTRAIDQDLACIVYTSGTTGRPLGVALTHQNLMANTRSILSYLPLASDDRAFSVLPFFYIYGASVLNTHVAVGGSLVIENQLTFIQAALDRLEAERCTGLAGVPSTFAILLNRSSFAERELPHLRYVTQAGGAMSPALTQRLIRALPGKRIYVMYGATEAAGRLAVLPPEELSRELGSVGTAVDNVELRVLDPDGREVGVGEEGELVARGSCIMRGYWNEPEATARVLDENGFHTGDIATRDERGFIRIIGRSREMLKTGGHRIAPREIEDALLEHEAIHEAAVIGVPHEVLGEAIHAHLVVRSEHLPLGELRAFLAARLPAWKLPTAFILQRELPKTGSGKVDKAALARATSDTPRDGAEAERPAA